MKKGMSGITKISLGLLILALILGFLYFATDVFAEKNYDLIISNCNSYQSEIFQGMYKPNSPIIISLLNNITNEEDLKSDKLYKIYNYCLNDIKYDYESLGKFDPEITIESGKGICVDKTLLCVSLIRSAGWLENEIYDVALEDVQDGWGHTYFIVKLNGKWKSFDPTTGDRSIIDKFEPSGFKNDKIIYSCR